MEKAILFDLDGTLLPMDQETFTSSYFKDLTAKMAPCGYDPQELIAGLWKGTAAMVKNDGQSSNEAVFWSAFSKIFGDRVYDDKPIFEEFYTVEFNRAKDVCGFQPLAAELVRSLRAAGRTVILASNPIFPMCAQENRIRWAGLTPSDFDFISSYENSTFCKPNPKYFFEVAEKIGRSPKECIMIGNDASEDLAAADAGMEVFLITDCLINKAERDISGAARGSFRELMKWDTLNIKK